MRVQFRTHSMKHKKSATSFSACEAAMSPRDDVITFILCCRSTSSSRLQPLFAVENEPYLMYTCISSTISCKKGQMIIEVSVANKENRNDNYNFYKRRSHKRQHQLSPSILTLGFLRKVRESKVVDSYLPIHISNQMLTTSMVFPLTFLTMLISASLGPASLCCSTKAPPSKVITLWETKR